MKRTVKLTPLMVACGLGFAALQAQAAGIITNGTVALGVKDSGALNVGNTAPIYGTGFDPSESGTVGGTGVRGLFIDRDLDGTPGGYEATFPGCVCEGWGAAIASLGITGYDGNGFSGLSVLASSFGTNGDGDGIATTTAQIVSGGVPVLEVIHDYKPSASAYLYQVDVTIKNISGGDLGAGATDLRYTRLMDWDTEPTAFSEFVTIQGHPATNLLYTNDDGFEPANPLYAYRSSISGCAPASTDFTDCGPSDHGARFDFGFPALLGADDLTTEFDDTVRTLTIFYGAAPTEDLADAARAVVGIEVYTYGQSSGGATTGAPSTFIFGFAGVGGVAPPPPGGVPEPTTLALAGLGLMALRWGKNRKTIA